MFSLYLNPSIVKKILSSLQKESFLKNAFSHNIRSFLQWFSETQMFDSFIQDSLWRIKYRDICQTQLRSKQIFFLQLGNCAYLMINIFTYFILNIQFIAFFEKRVDEYKWELSHDNEKLSRIIGKTVRNFVSII